MVNCLTDCLVKYNPKAKEAKAICEYFDINSVNDLVLRMPYILCHDYQTGVNSERRVGSLARALQPSDTVSFVYDKIKGIKNKYFSIRNPCPTDLELKKKDFPEPCKNGEYESVIVTCLQQAVFAKDIINYYLRFKEGAGKAEVVNVDIFKNGKKLYGHFITSYNGKMFDVSLNRKFADFDKTSMDLKPELFDPEVKAKDGINYFVKYTDYPVDLDWHSWNGEKNDQLKARKKLDKWKIFHRIENNSR